MAGINGNFAAGLSPALSSGVRAIFMAPVAREQAQLQSGLMSAQAAGAEATAGLNNYKLQQLRDPAVAASLDKLAPGLGALFATGGDANNLASAGKTAQQLAFRNQVLGNMGDPGTDPSKINMGTSVLEGKTYEPFRAVGDTGAVVNQGTGAMAVSDPGLRAIFGEKAGTTGQQVVDTPSGVQIVNTRTGVASPAVGPGGAPLMGDKAQAAQKAAQERGKAAAQAKLGLDSTNSALDRMGAVAREIMASPDLGRITGAAGLLPNVPGMPGADLAAKLNNLKSQVGFTVLQAMRDASKTGGALGAVSDKENELLQNNLAALDPRQSTEQFKQQLQQIIDYADGVKGRMTQAYGQQFGDVQQPAAAAPAAAPAATAPARAVPDSAASYLRANPSLAAAFDQKYGAGSAARILGK